MLAPQDEDRLIRENEGLVRYFARRRWHGIGRRRFDLADLQQLGRVELLRGLRTFDPSRGVKLGTWLGQRIKWGLSRAIAPERTQSRQLQPVSLDALRHPENEDAPGYEPAAPETNETERLEAHELWRAVDALPGLEADAIEGLAEGVTAEAAAAALGVSEGAILAARERGLAKLRKRFERSERDPSDRAATHAAELPPASYVPPAYR